MPQTPCDATLPANGLVSTTTASFAKEGNYIDSFVSQNRNPFALFEPRSGECSELWQLFRTVSRSQSRVVRRRQRDLQARHLKHEAISTQVSNGRCLMVRI